MQGLLHVEEGETVRVSSEQPQPRISNFKGSAFIKQDALESPQVSDAEVLNMKHKGELSRV